MNAKSNKKVLSADQKKEQRKAHARLRSFNNAHRKIFERAGFDRIVPVDGVHFTYEGLKSELDDIFVFENVIILAEYTLSNASNLGTHAKGKAGIHNKISENPSKFLREFATLSGGVQGWQKSNLYTDKQLIIKTIYGSLDALEDHHKALFDKTRFMSDSERTYFNSLTRSIKRSSRFEIFEYLGIDPTKVGVAGVVAASVPFDRYEALALPEEQSHFPSGFRVISFYVDPDALLRRSYVLRRNGWRDGLGLYQRLIIPGKIASIRAHLKEKKRVFANNVVLTLPSNSKALAKDGSAISFSDISRPTHIDLEIQRKSNSIGIIDGQHRIFSYYEDLLPEPEIDKFRLQQNLLATGIIYPAGMGVEDREKFEASLFLEINSTQAGASSDIIQAIWVLLDPFRPVSVARVIANKLAQTLPLKGRLARTSLDAGRIKTASIVAYGLQPLIKRSGEDSTFHIWPDASAKDRFKAGKATSSDLQAYVDFSTHTISRFLDECRKAVGDDRWKIVSKGGDGILSVTTINGLIILLRRLIEANKIKDDGLFPNLTAIKPVNFSNYKSSQYADLAAHMLKLIP